MENINHKQFEKLEFRVEKLDDKVDQIKEDIIELRGDVKMYANEVKKHVAGDEKIITEVLPTIRSINTILPELQKLVLESHAKKISEKEQMTKKKKLKVNLAIVGSVVGTIIAIVSFFKDS